MHRKFMQQEYKELHTCYLYSCQFHYQQLSIFPYEAWQGQLGIHIPPWTTKISNKDLDQVQIFLI